MASTLKNILQFTDLVVGVPSSQPHLIVVNDVAKKPQLIAPSGGGFSITANTTTVTVTRLAGGDASVNVYCEAWHSYEDAEPRPNGIPTGLFPFVVGGSGGGGAAFPFVDLASEYGVVADDSDPVVSLANANAINQAITDYSGTSTTLVLPPGDVYINKTGTNWSIKFPSGTSKLVLAGFGMFSTRLIQQGQGTTNDWYGILIDRATEIQLRDFSFEQGIINYPSSGQHDHLIFITNLGADPAEITSKIDLTNLFLGKCLGDCIAHFGDVNPIDTVQISNCIIYGLGFVQAAWAPNTAYSVGAQVRNGTNAYICITAGVSANSGGPTGTGADIVDGTVHWDGSPAAITYRTGARTGISFQRGYDNVRVTDVSISGVQNSCIDMESTGTGTCRSAQFASLLLDNSLGNTANAMSFSGSTSLADPTSYSSMDDIEIRNGALQIAETLDSRISNVTIVCDQAFVNDADTPLCYLQQDNTGLIVDGLKLLRIGTSGNGNVLAVQGFGRVEFRKLTIQQDTVGYPILVEASAGGLDDITFIDTTITYGATTPGSYDALNMRNTAGDIDRPFVQGLRVTCTSGTMRSAVCFNSRGVNSCRNIQVLGCSATGSSVLYGVYISKELGSQMDANPIVQGCDFGTATLIATVDEGDDPITGIYPIVAGNKKGAYTLFGADNPTGFARAPQGTLYINTVADLTKLYFKSTGTSSGGWSEVTVGAPSFAPYLQPTDAASWAAFIADTGIGADWAAPQRSWACQNAAGNATPAIGVLDLVASGAVTYLNPESGYTDVALGIPDNGAATGFSTNNAALPNPTTTSYLMVVMARVTAVPAANRSAFFISQDNQIRIINVAGQARARVLLVGNDVTPAFDIDTTNVHIYAIQVNVTASSALFATEAFKSEPAFVSFGAATKLLAVGGFDANSAPLEIMRVYQWEGVPAEKSLAQMRTLFEAFGASVAW